VRIAHLTTVDMSLALLLGTELRVDVDAGHEVVGISAPGPWVDDVEALGVRFVPVPSFHRSWDLRADLRATRELWRALRDVRPDVLHTHTPKAGVLGRVLGRLARIPVVVNTCHGLWATRDDPRARRMAVLAVEGFAARWSHGELYQNDEDRQDLAWAVPARRARTVGNGIDLERFGPDPDARRRLRAEWGVGDDTVLVGGVGRRVAEKGLAELEEAAADLPAGAEVVWIGPDDADKADRFAGARGTIRFLGPRTDMAAVYAALDVFVLPSHREGFSRSAMEAAATGLPLVLTDIRGCREIGEHDVHASFVPVGDTAALRSALAELIDDPARRERLGSAARARALHEFDQRRIARISLETYDEVLARRRR
jgi:glycosyltransferase involved in cell wall biosynthesis